MAAAWLVNGDKFVVCRRALRTSGPRFVGEIATFGGECSQNGIDRLRAVAEKSQCEAPYWAAGDAGRRNAETFYERPVIGGMSGAARPLVVAMPVVCWVSAPPAVMVL